VTGPDLDDEFLTVAEVAAMLKLNQQTVRNWIDQGSLPALRVGRRVRIKRSDSERIVQQGYTGGGRAGIGTGTGATTGGGGTTTGGGGTTGAPSPQPSQSAEDFWGGGTVGIAEAPVPAPASAPGRAP
jgi:excisionase family DNA binding protein